MKTNTDFTESLANLEELVLEECDDVRDRMTDYNFKIIPFNITSYNKNIDNFLILLEGTNLGYDVTVNRMLDR